MKLELINGIYTEASVMYVNYIMRKHNLSSEEAIKFIKEQEQANAETETNGSEAKATS